MKLLLSTIAVFIVACNLDVDTSDPMASESISKSRSDNLFIKEYSSVASDTCSKIKEAWVEYSWRYAESGCNIKKERQNGIQLAFSATKMPFEDSDFILRYLMEDSTYGYVGTSGGSYVIHLKENIPPQQFEIHVNDRIKKKSVCTIVLRPK